jgi:hypothetical protein
MQFRIKNNTNPEKARNPKKNHKKNIFQNKN